MHFFELKDLHKSFGDKHVLRGLNGTIEPRETLVVLGGSGTGKSVLLKTLIGLIQVDSGQILFEEEDIAQWNETQFYKVRKRVSYLFQGGALFDSMNVYQNLAYPLREHTDLPHEDILPKVREALAMVELEKVEHLYPSDLSGGMMKRVALARAIINRPEMVLYDEPTTGLDPITTQTINRMIRKLQQELNITSVVVTHDIATAKHVADRLGFLEDGKFAFLGTLAEAKQSDHRMLRAYLEGGNLE